MTKLTRVNNHPMYAICERMYVEEGLTKKAIASATGVSEQTIGKWSKGVGESNISWDEKKNQYKATSHNIKKVLIDELSHLASGGEATLDVKSIAEVRKTIEQLSDKTSVQVVFTVFKEFDQWMASQEPDTAILFLEWHKMFLQHKALQEG
ncbi:hypothetical protein V3Q90_05400 [Flavobacterium oreochromis]|uniref:hypothetical protein n=1 Tax=Flavobacterium oreochromis TaxID=2906078 RepID=UPI003859043C